ncbi:CHAT domain-containing protein, partial [Parapedobacter defluvii]
GCPSVVMSLWKIDEQSSTDIITVFYENLKNGESKSTALRNAKLKLMHQHAGRLSHPYYWAGLALIGDAEPLYKSYAWLYWSLGLLVVGVAGTVFIKRRKQQKAA